MQGAEGIPSRQDDFHLQRLRRFRQLRDVLLIGLPGEKGFPAAAFHADTGAAELRGLQYDRLSFHRFRHFHVVHNLARIEQQPLLRNVF